MKSWSAEVTQLLEDTLDGDLGAAEKLLPLVYTELREPITQIEELATYTVAMLEQSASPKK